MARPFLSPVDILLIPAVKDFTVDSPKNGQPDGSKIFFSEKFREYFPNGSGATAQDATRIHSYRLEESAPSEHGPIVTALGGKKAVSMSAAYMEHLIMAQLQGQEGALRIDGKANVIYVERNGVLLAVSSVWNSGWYVDAIPINGQDMLSHENLIFVPEVRF